MSFATNTPHRLKRQSKKASLLEKKEELLAKISRSHAKEKNGTESRTRKAFKWLRSNKKQRSRWADEIRKIDRELEKIK